MPFDRREQLQDFRASHPYKRFNADGVEWEYIASGQGDEALLILGGGLATGESSFRTILRYEETYRVVSPSYPSVGNVGIACDGLAALLDAEGISQAHVFGHSLGAGVAHVFMRRHRQRVDKLVLSGFGLYDARHARLVKLFFRLPFPVLRAYYRRATRRLMAGADAGEQAFMRAYVNELLTRAHARTSFMGQMRLLVDLIDNAEAYHVFAPVECPGCVLIIEARDDRGFSPAERAAFKATYPSALVYTFQSGGHWAGQIHREEYDSVMTRFLQAEVRREPEPAAAA